MDEKRIRFWNYGAIKCSLYDFGQVFDLGGTLIRYFEIFHILGILS